MTGVTTTLVVEKTPELLGPWSQKFSFTMARMHTLVKVFLVLPFLIAAALLDGWRPPLKKPRNSFPSLPWRVSLPPKLVLSCVIPTVLVLSRTWPVPRLFVSWRLKVRISESNLQVRANLHTLRSDYSHLSLQFSRALEGLESEGNLAFCSIFTYFGVRWHKLKGQGCGG